MYLLIFVPFILQAVAIFLDEYYFHLKRGLPKWERIGHPLDTLSVIACFAFVLFLPYSPPLLPGFIVLAIFSCLLVTKDEFVHKHHCCAKEQWLHALLFLNHPVMLSMVGFMWPFLHGNIPSSSWLTSWLTSTEGFYPFLLAQGSLTLLFFLYQVVYWNFCYDQKTHQ